MRVALLAIGLLAGCGRDRIVANPPDAGEEQIAPDGGDLPDAGGAPDAGGVALELSALEGDWDVEGSDLRGAYSGTAQVTADRRLLREIAWRTFTVEDGRALHWALTFALGQAGRAVAAQAQLDPRGFVSGRGSVTRSLADPPVRLEGTIFLDGALVRAGFSGAQSETWTHRRPAGAPPFTTERSEVPAHDPPSSDERKTLSAAFQSFRELAAVQPYAERPDFQAAVHGAVLDTTDFRFYRQNPGALRVIDKPIDPISLLEARLRADAFRYPLADKARLFDRELQADFLDPVAPMVPDGLQGSAIVASGDAALWNAAYIASQWYRYQVTGEPEALGNLSRSLDAELILQEITGDWSAFARSLRRATGSPGNGWHGSAAFPELEWLEGGNNDMFKGVIYALTTGFLALCDGRDHALCPRIRANVRHLADDVSVGSGAFNQLLSQWLTSIALDRPLDRAKYRARAEATWVAQKVVERNTTLIYSQGIADWSGTHLAFAGATTALLLADRADLGGDARDIFRAELARSFDEVRRQRLVLWDLAGGAAGDATWLLRELPFPKARARIDHRIDPAFSLSPYPSLPWKNDWTTTDRTQSLRIYPLFELPANVYAWKSQMDFAGDTEGYRNHGVDWLHAYWYGRMAGVLSGAE